MRIKFVLLIFFISLVASASTNLHAASKERAVRISIIHLLIAPKKYEGKLVTIRGFVNLEFEGNGIYLHREDFEQGLYSNGLWVNVSECTNPSGVAFKAGYAQITGRFTAMSKGHMGLWPGSIQDVVDCSSYPK